MIASTQAYIGVQYGYIIIPANVDRAKFIQQCYRWERVSILIERGGGVIHECYITRNVLQLIEFPGTSGSLGSCVLFLTDGQSGHPVVFGVLSKEDESQLLREGYFELSKYIGANSIVIAGDAQAGVLNLSVNGGVVSQLNITVTNKNKDAVINVRCLGNVNIQMDGTFKINKGTQSMIKGTELKTQLDKTNELLQALLNIISGAPVTEPGNGAPSALQAALQAAVGTKVLGDYTNIKSDESYLD